MRKNHNLPSYVAFVNLVKAYVMANHELLLTLLEKYGAPPRFVLAVKQMYQNLVVVLKIEKEVQELHQSVGVRQGDKPWYCFYFSCLPLQRLSKLNGRMPA
jgi:hypothetical protein